MRDPAATLTAAALLWIIAGCGGRSVDAGVQGGPSPCPRGAFGPDMVVVPGPEEGAYCIDRTEVPVRAVVRWIDSGPGVPTGISSFCEGYAGSLPKYDSEALDPDLPATYVTWCNAEAFCLANGKRLCGAIEGGYLVAGDASDLAAGKVVSATGSEWYRACTGSDASLEPEGCVQYPEPLERVGSRPRCEGGYPGIFDMTGNAAEWVGAWAPTNKFEGEWTSPTVDVVQGASSCAVIEIVGDRAASSTIGFRCCADLVGAEGVR